MNKYRLELSRQAEKVLTDISRFDKALLHRLTRALDELQRDPYEGKPLRAELKGTYSYRVGSYRIIYLIRHFQMVVVIIDIGHRKDIYR